MPPIKVWEIFLEEFQDGCGGSHLGHQNGLILTVLNLHVFLMPATMFQLNPTCHQGADVVSTFSMQPSWILEQHDFSNSKSPPPHCLPPSLGSIRLMVHEQIRFEHFQDGHLVLAVLNHYAALTPPIKFRLNPTKFGRRCHLKIFSRHGSYL